MPSNKGTQVQIFGQVYHLRGSEDAEYARRVARLVDDRMNAIADQMAAVDSFRVAVLAALHIADEYLRLNEQHNHYKTEVAAKSHRLVSLLDELEGRRDGVSAAAGSGS
jgi:cell division protein ZapA